MTFYVYRSQFPNDHPARPFHPERPHRGHAALAGIADNDLPGVAIVPTYQASIDVARTLHDPDYITKLMEPLGPKEKLRMLDGMDTHQSADSLSAALKGVGSMQHAINDVFAGRISGALVCNRPGGHHATRSEAMGFCLLGTAALAADHAIRVHGARVAVLDFDVHHGNGTEDLLWNEPDVFFASTHSAKLWPMTGKTDSAGAHGQIVNVPLPVQSGTAEMREAWEHIFDRVRAFSPDIMIISAGFDAHVADPISNLRWTHNDFEWLSQRLGELSREVCSGRTVTLLEGGYSLPVLWEEVPAYIAGIMGTDYKRTDDNRSEIGLISGQPYHPGTSSPVKMPNQRFEVTKAFTRLWIQDQEDGSLLYTPPEFLKLNSREPLQEIAWKASEKGALDIRDIITFERLCDYAAGYVRPNMRA